MTAAERTSRTPRWALLLLASGLLLSLQPGLADAAPYNRATYRVSLSAVQALNQRSTSALGAAGDETSTQLAGTPLPPQAVGVAGIANTGTNAAGLGFASGFGFARAETGVLKVQAGSEAQAIARPDSNVGASASTEARAEFTDSATFTAARPVYQNLLIIKGTLNLTGDMFGSGYGEIRVGGTGLNPQTAMAEWVGLNSGRVKDAFGGYIFDWVPGTPVSIPFSFTVYSGQATALQYWLTARTINEAAFSRCSALGGLCDTVQVSDAAITVDYSHTLAWGGVTVTDWFGNATAFTASSATGFDYANAAPVPEPSAALMALAGLAGLAAATCRRRCG